MDSLISVLEGSGEIAAVPPDRGTAAVEIQRTVVAVIAEQKRMLNCTLRGVEVVKGAVNLNP